jgi:hypothetical protein
MKNAKCKIKNIGYLALALALFSLVQPALAMGSAPKKEGPKYKVEILKMEIVHQPATKEAAAPKLK